MLELPLCNDKSTLIGLRSVYEEVQLFPGQAVCSQCLQDGSPKAKLLMQTVQYTLLAFRTTLWVVLLIKVLSFTLGTGKGAVDSIF